jgi:hypothetical protein
MKSAAMNHQIRVLLIVFYVIVAGAPGRASEPPAIPVLLGDEAFQIPNLGLSVFLPEDSLVDVSRMEGGRTTVVISPQGKDRSFVFQIIQSVSSDHALEPGEALGNIVEQRRAMHTGQDARGRKVTTVRVFDPDDSLLLGEHPAHRAYLDVPPDPDAPVTGYTLVKTGPGQFVIFQMDCPVPLFPRVRNLYEMMVASAQFRTSDEVGSERAAALLAGQALMGGFNTADYEAALDSEPAYYRLYRPSADGSAEEEIGYQRIFIHAGRAGELDLSKPESTWTSADKQPGFIARVEARALALGTLVDSVSTFFLSADRATELWTITMEVRKDTASERWVETGIRRDDRLTVKTTRSGEEPTNAEWSPLPKGYISRVETYLIPRLVARAEMPGIYGFYAYDSNLAKMSLRRDAFTAADAATGAGAAVTITTLLSENSRPITTHTDGRGRILRRLMPDGQVMTPATQAELKQIWAGKALPAP